MTSTPDLLLVRPPPPPRPPRPPPLPPPLPLDHRPWLHRHRPPQPCRLLRLLLCLRRCLLFLHPPLLQPPLPFPLLFPLTIVSPPIPSPCPCSPATLDPFASSSYSPLPCDSPRCRALDISACRNSSSDGSRGSSCLYQVSYGDGSYTVWDFAMETVTLGDSAPVVGVAIRCSHDNEGLFVSATGLLALGGGPLSSPSPPSSIPSSPPSLEPFPSSTPSSANSPTSPHLARPSSTAPPPQWTESPS